MKVRKDYSTETREQLKGNNKKEYFLLTEKLMLESQIYKL
jgi:hypothetical protein